MLIVEVGLNINESEFAVALNDLEAIRESDFAVALINLEESMDTHAFNGVTIKVDVSTGGVLMIERVDCQLHCPIVFGDEFHLGLVGGVSGGKCLHKLFHGRALLDVDNIHNVPPLCVLFSSNVVVNTVLTCLL